LSSISSQLPAVCCLQHDPAAAGVKYLCQGTGAKARGTVVIFSCTRLTVHR